MNILLVNWSWYPSGGDWTYISNLITLYEKNGHNVIPLSTVNEKNKKTNYPEYFIKAPDYKLLKNKKNIFTGFTVVKNSIVSFKALRKIDQILSENDIKVAHLHNIHHYITPAIIWKLKKANVKIIWTLHDFQIICPQSLFLSNGKICEKCITGNFYQCTLNKCKNDSRAVSMLASTEAYFYHKIRIYNKVDAYLCPSLFLKNKFIQFGFNDAKLHVTNSCYEIQLVDDFISNYSKNNERTNFKEEPYILYVGRIENMKGIETLINSVKNTIIKLKIVGAGEAADQFKEIVKKEKLNNIEFLGFKDRFSVFELIYNSLFVVCPSIVYENFPFSIIESFLFSKPVIGSKIGGIPELVVDGETGYLFEAGNADDLREKLVSLWNNTSLIKSMGAAARKHVYDIVNFETHWAKLKPIIENYKNNDN